MNTGSFIHRAGPAILVGLLGFVMTVDVRVQQQVEASTAARREELAKVVQQRQRRTVALERSVGELRARLDRLTAGSGSAELRAIGERIEALASASGLRAVRGDGLLVTLADAPDAELEDADFRIQDLDLQLVVNELWAAGAEAIAINGQRLVATSAIRNAGDAVLVNYRVLTTPYRVTAAGDRDALARRFLGTGTAKRFERWRDIYGLGFNVRTVEDVTLPPFGGSVRLRHAEPVRAG